MTCSLPLNCWMQGSCGALQALRSQVEFAGSTISIVGAGVRSISALFKAFVMASVFESLEARRPHHQHEHCFRSDQPNFAHARGANLYS